MIEDGPRYSGRNLHTHNTLWLCRRLILLDEIPVFPLACDIQSRLPLNQFIPSLTSVDGVEIRVWHIAALDPVICQKGDISVTH